jgi:hypothetical protein
MQYPNEMSQVGFAYRIEICPGVIRTIIVAIIAATIILIIYTAVEVPPPSPPTFP